MKLKRIVAYAAAALMLAFSGALLAACGNKGGGYQTDDLGIYKTDAEGIKVYKIVVLDHGVTINSQTLKYREQVMKEINDRLYRDLGFKAEFQVDTYADTQFADKVSTLISEGAHADLIRQNGTDVLFGYVASNVAKDITPYVDATQNLKTVISGRIWDEVKADGKTYAIPLLSLPVDTTIYARGDLLSKAGFKDGQNNPRPLSTLAEYESFLNTIKTGGQAYLDTLLPTVPLMIQASNLENLLLPCFTETPGDYFENGQLKPKIAQAGYKQYVQKVREWHKNGWIDDSIYTISFFELANLMNSKITALAGSTVWDLEFGSIKSTNTAHPDWQITPMLPLTSADGVYKAGAGHASEYLWVPYSSKSTGAAMRILDWSCNNEENYMLLNYGIKGMTYELGENNAVSVPEAEKSAAVRMPYDLMGFFMVVTNREFNLKYPSSQAPAAALDFYKKSMQIPLNKIYVDPMVYVKSSLSDADLAKLNSANNTMSLELQKILTNKYGDGDFESKWAAMVNKYVGDTAAVYTKLTQAYNGKFSA